MTISKKSQQIAAADRQLITKSDTVKVNVWFEMFDYICREAFIELVIPLVDYEKYIQCDCALEAIPAGRWKDEFISAAEKIFKKTYGKKKNRKITFVEWSDENNDDEGVTE